MIVLWGAVQALVTRPRSLLPASILAKRRCSSPLCDAKSTDAPASPSLYSFTKSAQLFKAAKVCVADVRCAFVPLSSLLPV